MYVDPKSVSVNENRDIALVDLEHQVEKLICALTELRKRSDEESTPSRLEPASAGTIRFVREIMRLREQGARLFPECHFSDPQWDILFDLYATEISQQRTCISSACAGANVPMTTGLRHIEMMVKQRTIVRYPDPRDGRRVFVRLSDDARERMDTLVANMIIKLKDLFVG